LPSLVQSFLAQPPSGPGIVLLDLDGTLTDPYPGISASIEVALQAQALPLPGPAELAAWIGPPMQRSFADYCQALGRGDPAQLLRDYRVRFDQLGWRENRVYTGIPEAMARLHGSGRRLLLATAKPHVFANRIVAHFGLAQWLDEVYGSELDGNRTDKTELLQHLLEHENLDPGACLMVGDREHDMRAARHHGIKAVGVLWGYGGEAELLAAGAQALVDQPGHLVQVVEGLLATCDSDG